MSGYYQTGSKLVPGSSMMGPYVALGSSVAVSSNGAVLVAGGPQEYEEVGAVWVYHKVSNVWQTKGIKLVGSDYTDGASPHNGVFQGCSVSISGDGNMIIFGGHNDNSGIGATWTFTYANNVWTQRGSKYVAMDYIAGETPSQGTAVAISTDASTAVIGGPNDGEVGSAWVLSNNGDGWTESGSKLIPTGSTGTVIQFGQTVAINNDGTTVLVGGPYDNNAVGAVWVFAAYSFGGYYSQQAKLVASDYSGNSQQGSAAIAISSDGNTAVIGAEQDTSGIGGAWVFVRSSEVWSQVGSKLLGSSAIATSNQGSGVSINAAATTIALGGRNDNYGIGAVWIFVYKSNSWTQLNYKLTGAGETGSTVYFGSSVALDSTGENLIIGGDNDDDEEGAVWTFFEGYSAMPSASPTKIVPTTAAPVTRVPTPVSTTKVPITTTKVPIATTTVPITKASAVPTNQPSFKPSQQPSVSKSPFSDISGGSSSTSTSVLVTVLASVLIAVVGLCCCAFFAWWWFRQRGSKKENYFAADAATTSDPLKEKLLESDSSISTLTKDNNNESKIIQVPKINWNDLKLSSSSDSSDAVIGKGAFGVVVKALWVPAPTATTTRGSLLFPISRPSNATAAPSPSITYEVAVKVLVRSVPKNRNNNSNNAAAPDEDIAEAMEEIKIIKSAESRVKVKDCLVQVHGIATGKLPPHLCLAMNTYDGIEAIGIVMRYEGGGSLRALLHNRDRVKVQLPMVEKLRLLTDIARGLAELHSVGIVHADIKPDNVLLSSDVPPKARLADFGLSSIRNEVNTQGSSISQTSHARGSPLYCAPEILHNPFNVVKGGGGGGDGSANSFSPIKVAKPSRKTDIYSFALLMWETLVEKVPFETAWNETVLSSMVHQGERPNLQLIPSDCPKRVVKLIEQCWQTDRSVRLSAVECFSVLQYQYDLMAASKQYDVFLSCTTATTPFTTLIFHRLTQLGFRVWFEHVQQDNDLSESSEEKIKNSISNSSVFVLVVDASYEEDKGCMNQLRFARSTLKPPRPVIPLLAQSHYLDVGSREVIALCQLKSTLTVFRDVNELQPTSDIWNNNEDGTTFNDMAEKLFECLDGITYHIQSLLPMNHE